MENCPKFVMPTCVLEVLRKQAIEVFCLRGVYGVSRFAHQTRAGLARYLIVTSAACFRSPSIGKGATVELFM